MNIGDINNFATQGFQHLEQQTQQASEDSQDQKSMLVDDRVSIQGAFHSFSLEDTEAVAAWGDEDVQQALGSIQGDGLVGMHSGLDPQRVSMLIAQ